MVTSLLHRCHAMQVILTRARWPRRGRSPPTRTVTRPIAERGRIFGITEGITCTCNLLCMAKQTVITFAASVPIATLPTELMELSSRPRDVRFWRRRIPDSALPPKSVIALFFHFTFNFLSRQFGTLFTFSCGVLGAGAAENES